jgi:hypothetical protein
MGFMPHLRQESGARVRPHTAQGCAVGDLGEVLV